jgi:hypothetical protein
MSGQVSRNIIDEAWKRSGGYCECTLTSHDHEGRCKKLICKFFRGEADELGWEVHSLSGKPLDDISDNIVMCSGCFSQTL